MLTDAHGTADRAVVHTNSRWQGPFDSSQPAAVGRWETVRSSLVDLNLAAAILVVAP